MYILIYDTKHVNLDTETRVCTDTVALTHPPVWTNSHRHTELQIQKPIPPNSRGAAERVYIVTVQITAVGLECILLPQSNEAIVNVLAAFFSTSHLYNRRRGWSSKSSILMTTVRL